MKEVIDGAIELLGDGQPCVLATVVRTKGSTPQKAGAMLLVRQDGTGVGTLGGGCVEGDIWFAAKTNSFLFRDENKSDKSGTNLWPEIFSNEKDGSIPKDLHARILQSNSFKLNWVLDPFMGKGSTGAAAKSLGRRFIGIDLDKDRVILSMKKIDQT